ncbi:MAG: polyphosphate kinase [Cytophagales bacterium]|nr:polyphosphate kinase [Cytophagales bacterium]
MNPALNQTSTLPPADYTKGDCLRDLAALKERLFVLQKRFYAKSNKALLVIFQGMDTAGKDSTIRHVMSSMNPAGVHVKSFKRPTEEELQHDFLWRVYPHFPPKGMIQVFNRSYYEDILVPKLQASLAPGRLEHRFELIANLERHLQINNTDILKFFLHVSKEEQLKRIEERKQDPEKRWKYEVADEQAALRYLEILQTYTELVQRCATVPWHVVPSDKKWYRNFYVAQELVHCLQELIA